METREVKLIVSNSPPFNKLTPEQVDKLISIAEIKEYHNREVIYRQGGPSDFLYLLLKGRVAASVSSEAKSSTIEILKRGTCFGLISLLTDETHSVTTQSIETSFVLQVASFEFKRFLEENPYFALEFSRILSQRVKSRSKPKQVFQSKKIGIIGSSLAGKTTFMLDLGKQLKKQTGKNVVCLQIIGQASGPGLKSLVLGDFKEEEISSYITKDEIDKICLTCTGAESFLSFLNFLSETYHFILYEIPPSFLETDLDFFVEPAQNLHFLMFPDKEDLKKAAHLIQELARKNPLNKEKIKVVLAEFSEADHLSFAKKRTILEHPIYAALPSRDSKDYVATLRRMARQIGEVTIGVALGSGAAYGYAHIGVLKVLSEEKIPIDIICGTSMGAVIAALWAAGFSLSEIEGYSRQIGKTIGSFSIFGLSIPLKGVMRVKRVEGILKRIFGDLTFYDLKRTLKIVTFDFRRRQTIVLEEGLIYKALAASCAFPGIFEPVYLRKDILLDGGVLDPLPTKILLQYGAHRIIASNITLSEEQASSEYAKRQRFHIFDFIFGSIETMQQQFIQQAVKLADVIIHSDLQGLGWTEFEKIDEFIKRGETATREKLPEIKKLTFL